MKLLILHLSDMHFIKSNSYSEANVDAIVSALQENVRDIKDIIIIISGDLTFSGFKAQYDDTEKFILSLKGKLCARYHFKSLNFAIVPGNHDVNYQIGLLTKDDLKQIEAKDEFEKRQKELSARAEEVKTRIRQHPVFGSGRILSAFPDMRHRKYTVVLADLQDQDPEDQRG